jgi:hypothetical protein
LSDIPTGKTDNSVGAGQIAGIEQLEEQEIEQLKSEGSQVL